MEAEAREMSVFIEGTFAVNFAAGNLSGLYGNLV